MKKNRLSSDPGSPVITPMPAPEDQVNEGEMAEIQKRQKIDKELIKKGYTCVQEKLKEIRQNFASAVTGQWISKWKQKNRIGVF